VDQHHFHADPDPTFHYETNSDPDPTPSFTHVGKYGNNSFDFYSQQCQSTLLYLSRQRYRSHNFNYFGQCIEILWKKV
jgi:hypothetical protein